MTHVIKYVGKPTPFAGKTLWEIVGNLKDFGVGRIVVRNSTKEFKEPSFLKILEVKARPNEIPRKIKVFRWPNDFRDKDRVRSVHVLCEQVYRGIKYEEPILITKESVLPDYSLVPKHLESNYVATATLKETIEKNVFPRYMEMPPLLVEILEQNGVKNPKMRSVFSNRETPHFRIAEEGEKPNKEFRYDLDTTINPNMYKGINFDI